MSARHHRHSSGPEIARNEGRAGYAATAPQERADTRGARPRAPRLVADLEPAAHATAQVVYETMYQAAFAHGTAGLPNGPHAMLHRRRRCRIHRDPTGETAMKTSPTGDLHADPRPARDPTVFAPPIETAVSSNVTCAYVLRSPR